MIAFRTTASKTIGSGHLRRCLTLAGELRARNVPEVQFWIDGDPDAVGVTQAQGFEARLVHGPEPETTGELIQVSRAEMLIADSYDFREGTFTAWRSLVPRGLVALDDLADRYLDASVVVNGSPHAEKLSYRTAPGSTLMLGPRYALLRPTFRGLPPRSVSATVSRVLVTLGGADPHGSTVAVLDAVRRALPDAILDVVIGPLFGPAPILDRTAAADPGRLRIHRGLDDLSVLMATADLAISGGGQTLYELAASGLPTIAIGLAANQIGNIEALAGVTLVSGGLLPDAAAENFRSLVESCRNLAAEVLVRSNLSRAGQNLIDGEGAARVADMLLKLGRSRDPVDNVKG